MKKVFGLVGVAALTFALAACGSSDKKESGNQLKQIQDAKVLKVATSETLHHLNSIQK